MRRFLLLLLLTACSQNTKIWECNIEAENGDLKEGSLVLEHVYSTVALFKSSNLTTTSAITIEEFVENFKGPIEAQVLYFEDTLVKIVDLNLHTAKWNQGRLSFEITHSTVQNPAYAGPLTLYLRY